MNRIQKYAAAPLTQSSSAIPHVTQHDEADITVLEEQRTELNARSAEPKLSVTAFLVKAVALALKSHEKLHASFDSANQQFVLKKYYNIGVAIDTPSGLVVGSSVVATAKVWQILRQRWPVFRARLARKDCRSKSWLVAVLLSPL